MSRKFYRLPEMAIFGVVAVIVLFSGAALALADCVGDDLANNKCFTTASGYTIRIAPDDDSCGGAFPVNGFPTSLDKDTYGWCYIVDAPTIKVGSISQINLQSPLSFYDAATNYQSALVLPSTIYSPFGYTAANGCLGDATSGFEVGDRDDCGMKWTLKVNPSSGSTRFYYKSKKYYDVPFDTRPVPVGVGVKIMAPKVGNSLEPGYILGARAIFSDPVTPAGRYSCQKVGDSFYKFDLDDYGCYTGVSDCGSSTNCSGVCTSTSPVDVLVNIYPKVNGKASGNAQFSHFKKLTEIGDLFGNRFCPSGQMVTTGSLCTYYYVGGKLTKLPSGCTTY